MNSATRFFLSISMGTRPPNSGERQLTQKQQIGRSSHVDELDGKDGLSYPTTSLRRCCLIAAVRSSNEDYLPGTSSQIHSVDHCHLKTRWIRCRNGLDGAQNSHAACKNSHAAASSDEKARCSPSRREEVNGVENTTLMAQFCEQNLSVPRLKA